MPGFKVHDIGGTKNSYLGIPNNATIDYLYKYTWAIPTLFDGFAGSDISLIQLRDATLPMFSVNKEVVMGGSLEYKFAKSVNFDDVKVAWYDSQGLLGIMRVWRESVWSPQDGLKVANDYKKVTELDHYLPDNANRLNRYTLINSWPSVIRHGELTYTDSEINLVEVTITYDWSQLQTLG